MSNTELHDGQTIYCVNMLVSIPASLKADFSVLGNLSSKIYFYVIQVKKTMKKK